MLSQLLVRNFAIAERVDVDFHAGMTVITGETGAGKSILLDAIGLALGDRADTASVGSYDSKAEVVASFDTQQQPQVETWLKAHDLDADGTCVLRRVISKEGKSRAFINNRPSPLADLRALGEQLINIHGQHAHQALLSNHEPTKLIDRYGEHTALLSATKNAYRAWHKQQQFLDALKQQSSEAAARVDYLKFQHSELVDIALPTNEFEALETELDTLQHAGTLIQGAQVATETIEGDNNCLSLVHRASSAISELPVVPPELREALELLDTAKIQLQEAASSVSQFTSSIDIDETRLRQLDDQLSMLYATAKKYNVAPSELDSFVADIEKEIEQLDYSDEKIHELETEIAELKRSYDEHAAELSQARAETAALLASAVESRLQTLRMGNCRVLFDLEPQKPSASGVERIALKVATNPGQTPQAIAKVASGGELSRIGLAIQVASAQNNDIPAMIFDEVDSGVGGAVAEVVGNLMRELSDRAQIFCVTHLAQVASKAHNHYRVEKTTGVNSVKTSLNELSDQDRIHEVARMIGGIDITKETEAHAKQMLTSVR